MIMHEHMDSFYLGVFVSAFFFFFNLFVSGIRAKIQGDRETPFISVYIASQLLFHKSR